METNCKLEKINEIEKEKEKVNSYRLPQTGTQRTH
jgi:hypothetical protein